MQTRTVSAPNTPVLVLLSLRVFQYVAASLSLLVPISPSDRQLEDGKLRDIADRVFFETADHDKNGEGDPRLYQFCVSECCPFKVLLS